MSNIISLVNQKGGVGKTTTAINLGASLAELEKEVLLIDIDPQGNLTQGVGFDTEKVDNTIYEVLTTDINLEEAIYQTEFNNLDIVPSTIKLANTEIELSGEIGRETILSEKIRQANLDYDYILLDCSPSLGLLTVNSLSASNDLIIPIEPSYFSLEGLEQLINIIKLIRKKINEDLSIKGVLMTRVDGRTNIAEEFEKDLKEVFGNKIFNTLIHQNVKIAEAQGEQVPINHYSRKAKGSKEYMKLAKEVVTNG